MAKKKLIIYIALFFLLLFIVFLPGYTELQKLKEENEQHKQRIKFLEEHNEEIKEELVLMREDPDYLEKKARDKFGIIKKDEIVYRREQKSTVEWKKP